MDQVVQVHLYHCPSDECPQLLSGRHFMVTPAIKRLELILLLPRLGGIVEVGWFFAHVGGAPRMGSTGLGNQGEDALSRARSTLSIQRTSRDTTSCPLVLLPPTVLAAPLLPRVSCVKSAWGSRHVTPVCLRLSLRPPPPHRLPSPTSLCVISLLSPSLSSYEVTSQPTTKTQLVTSARSRQR